MRSMTRIDHEKEFTDIWEKEFSDQERKEMIAAIDAKLDQLIASPGKQWGSIMNTSIEGGKVNPFTGQPGDWTGTPWHAIRVAHGYSDQQAGLFFGNLWKWRIIERDEMWIGIRSTPDVEPTFLSRGVTLGGKTYFLASQRQSRS